jgi:hypothetical protein
MINRVVNETMNCSNHKTVAEMISVISEITIINWTKNDSFTLMITTVGFYLHA